MRVTGRRWVERSALAAAVVLLLVPGPAAADDHVECEGSVFLLDLIAEDPCSGSFTLETTRDMRVEIEAHPGFTGCLYGYIDPPHGETFIMAWKMYGGGILLGEYSVAGQQLTAPQLPYVYQRSFGPGTYHFWVKTDDAAACWANYASIFDPLRVIFKFLGPVGIYSASVTPV